TISIAANPTAVGWLCAHNISGGNSGPVQGVDSTAVNAPHSKFPINVSCRGEIPYTPPGKLKFNHPNIQAAITPSSTTTPHANHRFENCCPHVNVFSTRMNTANTANTLTIPNPKTPASDTAFPRSCFATPANPNTPPRNTGH